MNRRQEQVVWSVIMTVALLGIGLHTKTLLVLVLGFVGLVVTLVTVVEWLRGIGR